LLRCAILAFTLWAIPISAAGKKKVILIGIDGMPPEQMQFFAKRGTIPNVSRLLRKGAFAYGQGSTPTDCPPNWTTISTGTWTGTNGINGFYRHHMGEPFEVTQHTTWSSQGFVKQEYLWEALGRAGKKSILVDWPIVAGDRLNAPNSIIIGDGGSGLWPILGPAQYMANRDQLRLATNWKNVPQSSVPPLEWRVPRTESTYNFPTARGVVALPWRDYVREQIKNANQHALSLSVRGDLLISEDEPEKDYYFLIYASGSVGYDRVLLTKKRDAADPLALLKLGEAPVSVHDRFLLEDGKRREGGFYIQVRKLHPQADFLEVFRTDIESNTGWSSPAGLDMEIAHAIGPYLVQESVLVQDPSFTGLRYTARLPWDAKNAKWLKDTAIFLARKTPDWDLLAVYYDSIDQVNHALMGDFLEQTYPGWQPDKHRFAITTMEQAFEIMDHFVGEIVNNLADEDTTMVLLSEHGHLPSVRQIALPQLLWKAGLISYNWKPAVDRESGQWVVDWSKTKCIPFYFADNIFINLKNRDPQGIVPPEDYEKTQEEIIQALNGFIDPESGKRGIQLALKKQDAFPLGHFGDDPYAGDVLYFVAPGYGPQPTDSTHLKVFTWNKTEPPPIDPASLYHWNTFGGGMHDSYPGSTFRDTAGNEVSLFTTVLMAGRGIKRDYRKQHPARLIDIAPTIALLLESPPPRGAEGSILYELLEDRPGVAAGTNPP
jgi:predicted AlkP superfamily phosphohydrolase/phosphomutase